MSDPRRGLPPVDRLLREPEVAALLDHAPRAVVVDAVREMLAAARADGGTLPAEPAEEIRRRVADRTRAPAQLLLNATGVVVHTNLGRAPLAASAVDAMTRAAAGYTALEYDAESGERGVRGAGATRLLTELTGAEDALVVNNAAAALVLALGAIAAGRTVLISRGELIEIGGSFRIPEILARSGARLREVGTTNRTRIADYETAFDSTVAAVLIVHRSNFEQRGFVETPEPGALAAAAHRAGVPCIHDVGSGLLLDLSEYGLRGEPLVGEAVAAGADLVIFSGDKLLGGPQAGCLIGRAELVERCRTDPLARALRADKVTLAALEATLTIYRDPAAARREVPVLQMLTLGAAELARRAEVLAAACPEAARAECVAGESVVGGGAFAGATIATTLVRLDPSGVSADELAHRLRSGTPPVVARVAGDRVVLDPRTLPPERLNDAARAVTAALG